MTDVVPDARSHEVTRPELDDQPVPDPGLPEHQPRPTDVDPRAEKRAERQVATLFGLSSLMAVLFCVAYFTFDVGSDPDVLLGMGASNLTLGVTLGLALVLIGVGAIHWARKLMNDHEMIEMRHPSRSSDEDREGTLQALRDGGDDSGIGRRSLVRNSLLGAMGALALPLVVSLRDLGQLPGDKLYHTVWAEGMRVVNDVAGTPIKPEWVEIGQLINAEPDVFYHPEEYGEEPFDGIRLNQEKAKAALIVVRMRPEDITPASGREDWGSTGSSPTPRSAPTSGARSPCGSSGPTTCCVPATSRPSTSPTTAR